MSVEYTGSQAEEIIDCFKPVANIEYTESVHAARIIGQRMEKHLSEGAATLCVVGDDTMRGLITDALKERRILDCMISVKLDAVVDESDLQKLTSCVRSLDSRQSIGKMAAPISSANIDALVKQWAGMKYGTGPDGQPAIASLDRYLKSPESTVFYVLQAEYGQHPFHFTQGEFADWCFTVREAASLFRPEWQLFHEHSVFQLLKQNLQDPEHFQQVTHTLFLLSEQASSIRDQYYKYIMKLKTEWILRSEEKVDVLENRLRACLELGYTVESAGMEVHSEHRTQLIARLRQIEKELISLKVIARYAQITESALVSPQIEGHLESLQKFRSNLSSMADSEMKSVNLLNQDDGRFSAIESEAQQFIDYINRTAIFASSFEMNTLSLQKQAAYIRYIAATLEMTLHTIYQHRGALEWFGYCQDLEPARLRLIRILSSLEPSAWEQAFENWYHYCRLSDAYLTAKAVDELEWTNVAMNEHPTPETWRFMRRDQWSRLAAEPSLKNRFLQFLETGNNTEYPVIWSDFLNAFAPVLRILFPIVLTDHDQFPTWDSTEYAHLVYVDYRTPNVEILQYTKTIYSWFAEGSLAAEPDFLVKPDAGFQSRQIAGLSRSEKLPFLRQLAEKIQDFGVSPIPYSLRNGCVLSFCSPGIEDVVKNSLYAHGLKKVASVPSQKENILAALLDSGGNVYILLEDGLPNGPDAENWRQQRNVLAWLTECGCTVVHICTKQAFYSHGESVRQTLYSTISNGDEVFTNRPVQLTFAFE